MLRDLIGKMPIDDVADIIYNFTNKLNRRTYNSWNEPTDGSSHARTFMDSVTGVNYPHYDDDYEDRDWYHKVFVKAKRK